MKKALIALGVVLAIIGLGFWWIDPLDLTGDGGFQLLEELRSPSGTAVAEVYAYRGGATVKGFTILVVHSAKETVKPEQREFRAADSEGPFPIKMRWQGDGQLGVIFPSADHRILLKTIGNVAIIPDP